MMRGHFDGLWCSEDGVRQWDIELALSFWYGNGPCRCCGQTGC